MLRSMGLQRITDIATEHQQPNGTVFQRVTKPQVELGGVYYSEWRGRSTRRRQGGKSRKAVRRLISWA